MGKSHPIGWLILFIGDDMKTKWTFSIPAFNAAQKFVYMNDLLNTERNSFLVAYKKRQLHADASSAVASIGADIGSKDSQMIASALDFLKSIAASERTKELNIIKDYRQKLEELLPNNKKLQQFLQKLDAGLLNNPQDIQNFYKQLTDYLNIIRKSTKEYKERLQSLEKHSHQRMEELAKDDYRFRAAGDVQALLNNVTGIATRQQEKTVETYATKIRQAAKEYLLNAGLLERLQSGEDIAAAMAAISLDIQKKMQDELTAQNGQDLIELVKNKSFDKIINAYNNADKEYETNLQKAIRENNMEFANILDAAKTILNIHTLTGKNKTQHENLIKKRQFGISQKNSLYKQLTKEFSNHPGIQELQYIDFNVGADNTMHGNVFELINVVQHGNTINIRGKTGADSLHLGSFVFDILTPDIQRQLMPSLLELENILTKYEQQKREDRFDDRSLMEKQMNKEIQEIMLSLDKQIEKLALPIENIFVYHESLKLYKSAETDEMSGFHGRDLVLMHYLDKLYSAENFVDLPNRNALDFLILNLSPLAVGGNLKNTVENYLAIFAGLLMFDDIQTIAQDALLQLVPTTKTHATQIHLYNLNGIYVPASMIITATYESMKDITNIIARGQAAKVTISLSSATSAISNYLNTRPKPLQPQWSNVAEKVASGTTIRITLLKAFTEFIRNLGI